MSKTRKYRGPETWARVRERYLAGEPAPALAIEFDVGLGNLRRRAAEEGWTRQHHARFSEPPNVRWAPKPGERLSRREMTVKRFKETWPELWGEMEDIAGECALDALGAHPEDAAPMCDWAYRWRAETFGPDCAAADRERRAELEREQAEGR
jgi:hypothetical protein